MSINQLFDFNVNFLPMTSSYLHFAYYQFTENMHQTVNHVTYL